MEKHSGVESLFLFLLLLCPSVESIVEGGGIMIFGSAVNSVSLLEKFLQPDYQSLIPRAKTLSSKKELALAQCEDPVLIEDGTMSFCLDKASGKRCIMLSPRVLSIYWLDSPGFWRWISIPESRFDKVPELVIGVPFKIHGVMDAQMLSQRTRYSAYVVYKTRDKFHDYKSIGVGVIVHGPPEDSKYERMSLSKIEEREDGWMEVEIGEFFNEGCDEIWFSIDEINYSYWYIGFIIQGIEFRPVKTFE